MVRYLLNLVKNYGKLGLPAKMSEFFRENLSFLDLSFFKMPQKSLHLSFLLDTSLLLTLEAGVNTQRPPSSCRRHIKDLLAAVVLYCKCTTFGNSAALLMPALDIRTDHGSTL